MTQPGDDTRKNGSLRGHWIFRRRTIDGAFWGLCLLSAGLGLANVVFQWRAIIAFEAFPAAYGLFGFISLAGIVFAGIGLRKVIMRDEDYYDR